MVYWVYQGILGYIVISGISGYTRVYWVISGISGFIRSQDGEISRWRDRGDYEIGRLGDKGIGRWETGRMGRLEN